jgi:hypothetical protein
MAEMNIPDSERETVESSSAPPLFVATVYEDNATAACAQRLIGRILRMSGHEMPVQNEAWGFHVLDQPDGMAAAGRRAGTADVLVIAGWRHSARLLHVIDWLQHWLAPRREKHGALVYISVERPEPGRDGTEIEDRLIHVARQIGMDFFTTQIPAITDAPHTPLTSSPPHEYDPRSHHLPASDNPARPDRR